MARAMENLPGSDVAMKTFDIFMVWPYLMQAVSLPGANSAMRVLTKSVTLRQTGDLADFNTFATRFRLMMLEFTKLFQDDATHPDGTRVVEPGYVKIERISTEWAEAKDVCLLMHLVIKKADGSYICDCAAHCHSSECSYSQAAMHLDGVIDISKKLEKITHDRHNATPLI